MSHYTTIITDLERGSAVLDFLGGSFDIHPEVQTSARDLAISVKDLTKRIKEYGTSTLNDLGLFLDSLFKNSMLNKFSLNEAFNIVSSISKKLDSMDEMANQYLGTNNPEQPVSHGLKSSEDRPHKPKITAAEDNTPAGKRIACSVCGASIPQYSEKYSSHCPQCGSPVDSLTIPISNSAFLESSDNFYSCNDCGRSFDSTQSSKKECPFCNSIKLNEKSLSDRFLSAIFETYALYKNITTYTDVNEQFLLESSKDLDFSIRPKTINTIVSADKPLLNVLSSAFNSIFNRDTLAVNEVSSLTEKFNISNFLNETDKVTVSVLFPLFVSLDNLTESSFSPKISEKIGHLTPDLFESIYKAKALSLALNEQDQQSFRLFLDKMYTKHPTPVDINNSYTEDDAAEFATSILGEQAVSELRQHVSTKHDLLKNLKSLSLENFNEDQAIKVYSSCLTRTCIQNSLNENSMGLDIFKQLIFENMNGLLNGNRAKAINFVKGVFLPRN